MNNKISDLIPPQLKEQLIGELVEEMTDEQRQKLIAKLGPSDDQRNAESARRIAEQRNDPEKRIVPGKNI